MKIIIGLGNPGKRYVHSRHNLGFLVIDRISKNKDIPVNKKKYYSLVGEGRIEGSDVLLIKPQTYMNHSGKAVRSLSCEEFFDLKDLLIICDDINLPEGSIRLKPSGSAGGHKGLKSIIDYLQTEDFPRLRIGIGKKMEQRNQDLSSYVLKSLDDIEEILKESIDLAESACYLWIRQNIEACMNRFNKKGKLRKYNLQDIN